MDREHGGPEPHDRTAGTEGRAVPAPSQIGEALWRGRLRMGLSLDDVAARARTDIDSLTAVEESNFSRLPSAETVIATAKAYARVVRLPESWVVLTLTAELARMALDGGSIF